jgi:hypothetical protein
MIVPNFLGFAILQALRINLDVLNFLYHTISNSQEARPHSTLLELGLTATEQNQMS